jgi:hypothetical protein
MRDREREREEEEKKRRMPSAGACNRARSRILRYIAGPLRYIVIKNSAQSTRCTGVALPTPRVPPVCRGVVNCDVMQRRRAAEVINCCCCCESTRLGELEQQRAEYLRRLDCKSVHVHCICSCPTLRTFFFLIYKEWKENKTDHHYKQFNDIFDYIDENIKPN